MTDKNNMGDYGSAPTPSKDGKSSRNQNRTAEVRSKKFPWKSIVVGAVILIIMAVVVSVWWGIHNDAPT